MPQMIAVRWESVCHRPRSCVGKVPQAPFIGLITGMVNGAVIGDLTGKGLGREAIRTGLAFGHVASFHTTADGRGYEILTRPEATPL